MSEIGRISIEKFQQECVRKEAENNKQQPTMTTNEKALAEIQERVARFYSGSLIDLLPDTRWLIKEVHRLRIENTRLAAETKSHDGYATERGGE